MEITAELIEQSPEEIREQLTRLQLEQEKHFRIVEPGSHRKTGGTTAPPCPNRTRVDYWSRDKADPRATCDGYGDRVVRIYDRRTTGAYEYAKQRKRKFVPIGWRCTGCGSIMIDPPEKTEEE